jgi:hypothetical protein
MGLVGWQMLGALIMIVLGGNKYCAEPNILYGYPDQNYMQALPFVLTMWIGHLIWCSQNPADWSWQLDSAASMTMPTLATCIMLPSMCLASGPGDTLTNGTLAACASWG